MPRVRWGDLLWALPAFLVASLLVAMTARGALRSGVVYDYTEKVKEFQKAGDYKAVSVAARRLTALKPEEPLYRMWLLLAYDKIGDPIRAEALARTIAPLDKMGFPAAHRWLGMRLLGGTGRPDQRIRQAEIHMRRYLEADPNAGDVKALLGQLYLVTNRPRDARPLLESVAEGHADLLVQLSTACKLINDDEQCHRRANEALAIIRKYEAEHPDDPQARLLEASAMALLDDFQGAVKVVESTKIPDEKARRAALSTLYNTWDDSLLRNGADPKKRLDVLEKGLEVDPTNSTLFAKMSELLSVGGETAARVRSRLAKMREDGSAPALVEFALGNDEWLKNENESARKHWEKSISIDPNMVLAANNLAWSLAYKEPVDRKRALELIDKAVGVSPGDRRLRGTRGQVLAKLGRWRDAAVDLEAAMNAGESSPTMHEALADAYDNLGMSTLAAQQRKLAK